jgi:hypothetical protein
MSARRIRVARWLYGGAAVLAFLMGMGLPFPPRGSQAAALFILLACFAASVAMAVGLRRWYAALRPLSAVLGIYGLYTLGTIVWALRSATSPLVFASLALSGTFASCYLIAMLLLARAPAAKSETAPA